MPYSAETLREKMGILREAFQAELGRQASDYELQAAAAVAWAETGFGSGWGKMGSGCADSHNWGAMQSLAPSCCFTTDHHQDGSAYKSYFKCYPDDLAAARDMIAWFRKKSPGALEALAQGDFGLFSLALYRSHYYEGVCSGFPAGSQACADQVVRAHATGLHRHAREVAAAMGVPAIPLGTVPEEPTPGGASPSSMGAFALVGIASVAILALTLRKR